MSGTVTLDGKPVSGVNVVFSPTGLEQQGAAVEVIDGKFAMTASVGPSAGSFDVTFDTIQPDLEDFERLRAEGKKPFSSLRIHARYRKAGTVTAEVEPGRENVFHYELKSR